jgi:hypothetical protein
MLEKRREDRPAGWREIVDRLVAVLRSSGSTARLPESVDQPLPPAAATGRTALVAQTPTTLPPRTGRGVQVRMLASVVAGALVLVLAATWYSRRARETGDRPVRPRPTVVVSAPMPGTPAATAAPAPLTGRLRILALPYARILSVVDAAGRPMRLPRDATTPLLLRDLAPGAYRVVLGSPGGSRRVERRVDVAAGTAELLSEPFETPSSLAQMLRTGGSNP